MESELTQDQVAESATRRFLAPCYLFVNSDGAYAAIIATVAAAILIVDLTIPLGVAAGVPYLVVVLIAARTGSVRWTIATAIICSGLIGVGYLASPSGGETWKVASNRVLALFAVWVTGVLTLRFIVVERAVTNELLRIDNERSRFLANISHELKTPLTSVLAFADVLSRNRDKTLTKRQLDQIGVLSRGARRLDGLINDLLDMSKSTTSEIALQPVEFDARPVLQDVLQSFGPILEAKHQALFTSWPEHELWLTADKGRMVQVMMNLISNASKYSAERSEIRVEIGTEGEHLMLSVTDNGVGISEHNQTMLFTPFFRVDNFETRSVSGTGLGLAIVQTIVEAHGGTISLDSEPGNGSTFTVRFPGCATAPSEHHLAKRPSDAKPEITGSRLA